MRGVGLLRNAAVLAGVVRTAPDKLPCGCVHLGGLPAKKPPRLSLNDGDPIEGFDEILILCIFGCLACSTVVQTADSPISLSLPLVHRTK